MQHNTVQKVQRINSIGSKLDSVDGQYSSLVNGHFIAIVTNHALDCYKIGSADCHPLFPLVLSSGTH